MSVSNNSNMYESCIAGLQNAKSDTEKFAALLLVTKVVKADDCDRSCRQKIFDAIGFDFVDRLLNTEDVPDGCPIYIFKAIGLTLLSCFCMEPDLISHEKMRSKISDLTDLILTAGQSYEEQDMINDALTCISSVINSNITDPKICKEVVPNLIKIIVNDKHGCIQCSDLICNLSLRVGSVFWEESVDSFDFLMTFYSAKFVNDYSETKFILCKKMTALVTNCPYRIANDQPWCREIRKGLGEIFYSKVTLPQLHPALMLTTAMIERFGVDWAFGDDDNKFFLIFAQLICIEVRMIVEDRKLEQVIEVGPLLMSCFVSLENIIAVLINKVEEIDYGQRQHLYAALTATMNGVLYFLSSESTKMDSLAVLPAMERQVIFSCVRVVGAWLAEETSALRDDVYAILPFIIEAAVFDSDNCDGLNIFRFLLPGMCHLTAEDKPRNILIGLKFHKILLDFMLSTWKLFKSSAEDVDERKDSLVTACGVFMNMIVMDASLVANDETFHKLLRFVFNALSELENESRHLILIGNLTLIGLMLLRHYADEVKPSDDSIDSFLSISIKFLAGAYNLEDSSGCHGVVVAKEYRDVWDQIEEVWYLAIRALAAVLKKLPWIGKVVLESGWIGMILQILRKVKAGVIDAGTKNELEYFLCCLVPTDKGIQQILLKEGGREFCFTHGMNELVKLLPQ